MSNKKWRTRPKTYNDPPPPKPWTGMTVEEIVAEMMEAVCDSNVPVLTFPVPSTEEESYAQ